MSNLNYLTETIITLEKLVNDLKFLRAGKQPDLNLLDNSPLLNDWVRATRSLPCLEGMVLEHPKLGSRRLITTSELFYVDPQLHFARTYSRFYRLGKPAPVRGLR
ncbi:MULTISPECIES: DUF6634 family protein [Brucella]|uniref:DUF6634 family protein n=1 Tax=Brucella TaxID=234 RepID=UPI00124E3A32|nr:MULTISPECIES: DUF6634 family protein [Brucella]KAB2747897.1 hypothetical protein F9L05_14770 [Brucella anthropi]CAB4325369.1 hypothetical protein BCH_00619 [Brucella sp. 191011898]